MSTAAVPRALVGVGDEETRQLYCAALRDHGFDVSEASDGRQALVSVLTAPPTVVVLDASLPHIDGFALCDIFERDPATRQMQVLLMIQERQDQTSIRVRALGADGVLVTPCALDLFVAEVKRLCTNAALLWKDGQSVSAKTNLTRSYQRYVTKTPPDSPPQPRCPSCDEDLTYIQSYIGGVSDRHAEQWDTFMCSRCRKAFEYRHRTRKLDDVN
jgi:CheY-like chemotaxis protein